MAIVMFKTKDGHIRTTGTEMDVDEKRAFAHCLLDQAMLKVIALSQDIIEEIQEDFEG